MREVAWQEGASTQLRKMTSGVILARLNAEGDEGWASCFADMVL